MVAFNSCGRIGGAGRHGGRVRRGSSSLCPEPIKINSLPLCQYPHKLQLELPAGLEKYREIDGDNLKELSNLSKEISFGINKMILNSDGELKVFGGLYGIKFIPSDKKKIHKIARLPIKSMYLTLLLLRKNGSFVTERGEALELGGAVPYEKIRTIPFELAIPVPCGAPANLKVLFHISVKTDYGETITIFKTSETPIELPR